MKSLLALALLAACSHTASPKAAAESPPRADRLAIGSLEAYALLDGHLTAENDAKTFGLGHTPSDVGDVLVAAGLPRDAIHLDIQCLLVKAGDQIILFDTGLGAFVDGDDAGHLPTSLALAGVEPGAITDIFISHTHTDHVGGLITAAGALAFPAATIHLSAPEWAEIQADPDKNAKKLVTAIATKVAPFEPGAQVLPLVKAVATPGHTLGHSSYEIGDGADKLFYLGDVAHHVVISVQRPAWGMQYDHDRVAGATMRQQTLARLAAAGTRVFAGHFPYPGVGRVAADGETLAWKPEGASGAR